MNLIYFDNEQLMDYLFGDVEYNNAYNYILRKTNSSIWTGILVDDFLKVIQNDGRYFSQHEVKANNVTSVWVRGKMPKSLFKFLKSNDIVVFNDIDVQKIADDKNETYKFLDGLMPKQFEDYQDLISSNLSEKEEVIIKPFDGLKGQGINIVNWNKVNKKDFENNIVQKVVKPSKNSKLFKNVFGEIKEENYDIRMVCVDSNIAYFTLRKSNDRICNAARGASLVYIPIDKIDENYFNEFDLFKNIVLEKLPNKFKKSIFSIDFCLDDYGNYIVFELNSYPGIRYQYKEYINLIIKKINEINLKKKKINNRNEFTSNRNEFSRETLRETLTGYNVFSRGFSPETENNELDTIEIEPDEEENELNSNNNQLDLSENSLLHPLHEIRESQMLSPLSKILKSIFLIYNNDLFNYYFPDERLNLSSPNVFDSTERIALIYIKNYLYNLSLFNHPISVIDHNTDNNLQAKEFNTNIQSFFNQKQEKSNEEFQKVLTFSLANRMSNFFPYFSLDMGSVSERYESICLSPSYIDGFSSFLTEIQGSSYVNIVLLKRNITEMYTKLLSIIVDNNSNYSSFNDFFVYFRHLCKKMSFFVGLSILNALLYNIYLRYFVNGYENFNLRTFKTRLTRVLQAQLLGSYLVENNSGFSLTINPRLSEVNNSFEFCEILEVIFRESPRFNFNKVLHKSKYSHVANKLINYFLTNNHRVQENFITEDFEKITHINSMFFELISNRESNNISAADLNNYFKENFVQ